MKSTKPCWIQKHASFTGGKAQISREVGGAYTAYDDYIAGKNIELVPDKKIVQDWRAVDWPGRLFLPHYLEFSAVPEGSAHGFHTCGSAGKAPKEFTQGWTENYWEPMKAYFAK